MDKQTSPNTKKSFFKEIRKSFSRSRFQDNSKQSGKSDYIRTNVQLASEEQSKHDDKQNRKIYEYKMNMYRQIKSMIDDSEIIIDFDITNEPLPPPTPDNHTLWLKYQQDMTPQPSWKVVNATAYLIKKGYQPGTHFHYHRAVEFCMEIATQNNEPDILEYRPIINQDYVFEKDDHTTKSLNKSQNRLSQSIQPAHQSQPNNPIYERRQSIPSAPPEYVYNDYNQQVQEENTNRYSSLYNIELPIES